MGKRFTITFPAEKDSNFTHRVRNFAEDIYREIETTGLGAVCDIDQARDAVWFELNDSHDVGHARKILRRELENHRLTIDATVAES
jgi:hypothetical protein